MHFSLDCTNRIYSNGREINFDSRLNPFYGMTKYICSLFVILHFAVLKADQNGLCLKRISFLSLAGREIQMVFRFI